MDNSPEAEPELPANLKFLRVLVTVLTATMIIGLVVLIVLLVTRFPDNLGGTTALPAQISLPEGVTATAFTQGSGWFAIVTAENQILIFDASSGEQTQTIEIVQD